MQWFSDQIISLIISDSNGGIKGPNFWSIKAKSKHQDFIFGIKNYSIRSTKIVIIYKKMEEKMETTLTSN